ncbi:chemotaxis protein [Rhizobium pisi]|uniref:chemotaxis protein n=1 Tax=Rhizobium pisi TaxID=574561 RepID=UPI0039B05129
MVERANGPIADLHDQKARFCAEMAGLVTAVMSGDVARRMNTDYADPDLRRSAAILNELIVSIDDNLADFNQATAALAQGDLHGSMREKHRGAFGQLQRNFNLAVATFRAVLGEQGADQFADKAAKFRQMLTTFKSNEVSFGLRISDEDSRPIPSPAHDLWVKLADALDGPQNDSGKTA